MPATYAHYRMGASLLPTMPADVRRTIGRFRRLYDVGLHGPDIFYFHGVLLGSGAGALGDKFHSQTGREFFQRVCRTARLERSEAAQAYLYGVLCHYVLDSICHPFIAKQAELGPAGHSEIEAEFERYLLELDGKVPPTSQNMGKHIQLTPGECETVAKFYPPASSRNIQECVKNMSRCVKILATPEGARRNLLKKVMNGMGPNISGMLMTPEPNPRCAQLDEKLMALYNEAVERFPDYLNQLEAHMTYNALFDEDFQKIFG